MITLHSFRAQLKRQNTASGQRLLVALSGGMDSMVLCHLLLQCKFQIELAHMNFRLRGKESDGDEKFVREYARTHGLVMHVKRANATQKAFKNKIGIQEAARQMRYAWFEALVKKSKHQLLLMTAHHQDDQAETVLFNFVRGTGIRGLAGIGNNDMVKRPLLPWTRKELEDYARKNNIAWREDSSNSSKKYTRNYIRHEVMPLLHRVNPSFSATLSQQSHIYAEVATLLAKSLGAEVQKNLKSVGDSASIPVAWIRQSGYPRLLLWHMMEPLGLAATMVEEAMHLLASQSGKTIYADGFHIVRDRAHIIIAPHAAQESTAQRIQKGSTGVEGPCCMQFEVHAREDISTTPEANLAYLDMDTLQFPLTLRPWAHGDTFVQIGMRGRKKISDLLTSLKLSGSQRSRVHVLLSGDEICWVVGIRIGEHYKISDSTRKVFLAKVMRD